MLDVPITISLSIVMLFRENTTYGLIGLYWITLVFFLQRYLCDLMGESVKTKVRLI